MLPILLGFIDVRKFAVLRLRLIIELVCVGVAGVLMACQSRNQIIYKQRKRQLLVI